MENYKYNYEMAAPYTAENISRRMEERELLPHLPVDPQLMAPISNNHQVNHFSNFQSRFIQYDPADNFHQRSPLWNRPPVSSTKYTGCETVASESLPPVGPTSLQGSRPEYDRLGVKPPRVVEPLQDCEFDNNAHNISQLNAHIASADNEKFPSLALPGHTTITNCPTIQKSPVKTIGFNNTFGKTNTYATVNSQLMTGANPTTIIDLVPSKLFSVLQRVVDSYAHLTLPGTNYGITMLGLEDIKQLVWRYNAYLSGVITLGGVLPDVLQEHYAVAEWAVEVVRYWEDGQMQEKKDARQDAGKAKNEEWEQGLEKRIGRLEWGLRKVEEGGF